MLAKRGYGVILADARAELGGRVTRECRLPGLSEWARVRDHRAYLLTQRANVSIYLESELNAEQARETGAEHLFVATGSRWRKCGMGRTSVVPILGLGGSDTVTPDDIMDGRRPDGPVVVYDDDGYYMAAVLAELLAAESRPVTYVTPAAKVSWWADFTEEADQVHRHLDALGVAIVTARRLTAFTDGQVQLACVYTGRANDMPCRTLVPVTSREPNDGLWRALAAAPSGFKTLQRIGDCRAPGIIATAVYDGHRRARELGLAADQLIEKRERVCL